MIIIGRRLVDPSQPTTDLMLIGLIALLALADGPVRAHHDMTQILTAEFGARDLSTDATITVDKTRLHYSSEWIAVSWSGVQHPKANDWIALYSPSNVDIVQTAPIKFRYCRESESHLHAGSGSLLFSVVNMRADLRFVLFRGGISSPVMLAQSEFITFDNPNEPVSAYLSFTNSTPSELRLSWTSLDTKDPTVQYWVDDEGYTAQARTISYSREEMCGPPASGYGWRDPGLIHHAILTGLSSSVRFQYRYGSPSNGWSYIITARVPPAPADDRVAFWIFGDLGTASVDGALSPFWTQPASRLTTDFLNYNIDAADFVLHIGDISYAVGFQSSWDAFLDQISYTTQRIPYQVAIGNHERDYEYSNCLFEVDDSGGECGVPYMRRFPIPEGFRNQTWYSFESGPVHILVMSTEHDFSQGSDQYKFIQNDLRNVDRIRTPWVVVAGHRPMYVDSIVDIYGNASERFVSNMMRRELEHLFVETKVDLALWGHDHSYQRSCPVYNLDCIKRSNHEDGYLGPVHLVVGSAGMQLSPNGANSPPEWLHNRIDDYGIGLIRANKTSLLFQFVRDRIEQVADELLLEKRTLSRRPVQPLETPNVNVAVS